MVKIILIIFTFCFIGNLIEHFWSEWKYVGGIRITVGEILLSPFFFIFSPFIFIVFLTYLLGKINWSEIFDYSIINFKNSKSS